MAIVVLAFGGVVGYVAMPALAGLLMIVGVSDDQTRTDPVGGEDGRAPVDRDGASPSS